MPTMLDMIRARRQQGILRPMVRAQVQPRAELPIMLAQPYREELEQIVSGLERVVRSTLISRLPDLMRVSGLRVDADDLLSALETLRTQLSSLVSTPRVEEVLNRTSDRVLAFQERQFRAQLRSALGVDPFLNNEHLAAQVKRFAKGNVLLVKSIPAQLLDDLYAVIATAYREGTSRVALAKEIESRFEVTKKRAQLIADDQIGHLYSDVTKTRQQNLGITHYIWRTAKDARVRDSHAKREGKVYAWSDPPSDGHPGQAIRCRCYAEPKLDDIFN